MVEAWRGPSTLPFGVFTLDVVTAWRTSSSERPKVASGAGSTCRRSAGRILPCTITRPTPPTCASRCASSVSAASLSRNSGSVPEVSASVITGGSAGFTLE